MSMLYSSIFAANYFSKTSGLETPMAGTTTAAMTTMTRASWVSRNASGGEDDDQMAIDAISYERRIAMQVSVREGFDKKRT